MSTTPSSAFFSNDLIILILTLLRVKSLLRFKCVSKSWNTLISNPYFVKSHLKKSTIHNPHLTLFTEHANGIRDGDFRYGRYDINYSIVPYPICRLLDNPSFTLSVDPNYHLNSTGCSSIVGSCNGLICLVGDCSTHSYHEYWIRIWNPATRTISERLGYFQDFDYFQDERFQFTFGCDNSTDTYKVLASSYIRGDQLTSDVRVFNLGDNVWRNIDSFPIVPLHLDSGHTGVFFNGTFNWLAIHNDIPIPWYNDPDVDITVEKIVIVSLDLGTETYNKYLLPQGFDEVPPAEPIVGVLGQCLCFSYCYKDTNLIIWQMKKFGIEESWTQILKISYHDLLSIHYFGGYNMLKHHLQFLPLFLSKDGNTLILHINIEREAILYNLKDNRVERTRVTVHKTINDNGTGNFLCWNMAKNYVESLISIC